MIHRAMAGSIERFTAILAEHFAGKWPFWMSPRQIIVIPVGMGFLGYAKEVAALLKKERFHVGMYPRCPFSTPERALTKSQMSTAAATPSRRRSATANWLNVSESPPR
jgi:threonyl-tRNA synthetase